MPPLSPYIHPVGQPSLLDFRKREFFLEKREEGECSCAAGRALMRKDEIGAEEEKIFRRFLRMMHLSFNAARKEGGGGRRIHQPMTREHWIEGEEERMKNAGLMRLPLVPSISTSEAFLFFPYARCPQ